MDQCSEFDGVCCMFVSYTDFVAALFSISAGRLVPRVDILFVGRCFERTIRFHDQAFCNKIVLNIGRLLRRLTEGLNGHVQRHDFERLRIVADHAPWYVAPWCAQRI